MTDSLSSNHEATEFPKGSWSDRYEIREAVGAGAMAVVYRAFDRVLRREVALKLLHRHLSAHRESKARLQAEAQAVARLRHDNIVAIFDYAGAEDKDSYLVTEFIDGRTLRQTAAERPLLPLELTEMILHQVCVALEHAHGQGVIHRDLKPENVMIRRDGKIKLMDFGLAHVFDRQRLTVTGQLLGSPAYMAPEQIEGKPIDTRVDLFSFGVLAYELTTGKLPFVGKNPHEVLLRISSGAYQLPSELAPRMSRQWSDALCKALRTDPQKRWSSAIELRSAIEIDLAQAGILDPAAELARAFSEPDWQREVTSRIVDSLTLHGRSLYRASCLAQALDAWNRALMLAPDSIELDTLIRTAQKRGTRSKMLTGGLLLALLGAILIWHRDPTTPPALTRQTDSATHDTVGATQTEPSEKVARQELATPVAAKPRATAEKRRIHLAVFPPGKLRVSLDRGRLEEYDPRQDFWLRSGAHEFALENPCCFRELVFVNAHKVGDISVRLRWRPARLVVLVSTEGPAREIDVLVDDKIAVRPGQAIDIPIDVDSIDGKRKIRIKVFAQGQFATLRDVVLRAGEKTEQTMVLDGVGQGR